MEVVMFALDDLQEMIDILGIAIAREESEERFFRRTSKACKGEVACRMFAEIAGEFESHRKSLESRKTVLVTALEDMKKSQT
jgi:rubrerythrin